MPFADLHMHSTYSDGIVSPSKLVKLAAEKGVGVLALTDHDNIDGLNEAFAAAKETGVRIIPAVEVSTTWYGKPIHLTVYGFKLDDRAFLDFLKQQCRKRKNFFAKKIEIIAPGLVDEFVLEKRSFFGNGIAGSFLVSKGIFSDLETARRALESAKVESVFAAPEEAIEAAHRAGAVACLAHPFAPKISLKKIDATAVGQEKLVAELVAQKLDGIECYQAGHSAEDANFALSIAADQGLMVSGGSDWHGPLSLLGEENMRAYIPYYCDYPGALKTPASALAPLLERLGVGAVPRTELGSGARVDNA